MPDAGLSSAKILIVDDQVANVLLLRHLQEEDLTTYRSLTDPRQALPVFLAFQPDLILLDIQMPYLNGFELLKQIRAHFQGAFLPVLMLTADNSPQTKRQALAEGASDFLTKPFDPTEVILRIQNLLQTRQLHQQLQNQNEILELKVRERTAELEAAQVEILQRLALAAEYRDDDTGQHTQRVGQMAGEIASVLGLPGG